MFGFPLNFETENVLRLMHNIVIRLESMGSKHLLCIFVKI